MPFKIGKRVDPITRTDPVGQPVGATVVVTGRAVVVTGRAVVVTGRAVVVTGRAVVIATVGFTVVVTIGLAVVVVATVGFTVVVTTGAVVVTAVPGQAVIFMVASTGKLDPVLGHTFHCFTILSGVAAES